MTVHLRALPLRGAVGYAALCGLALWLFGGLVGAFWRADDPALLAHAMQSRGWDAFTNPSDWRKLSPSNLTPWVTLSFKVDLALAGLKPQAFYAHQLLSLLALLGLSLLWLRRRVGLAWACVALSLFLLGAPTGAVVEALMTRHYLEGLLATVLALLAFERAAEAWKAGSRGSAVCWYVAVLFAYAVAASAKEVYVPLPVLLLAWPGLGGWRQRLAAVGPMLLMVLGYALWRQHMLGAMAGGYGASSSLVSAPAMLDFLPALAHFPEHLWGRAWPLPTLLLAWTAVKVCGREPGRWAFLLLLAVLVLGPLIPLVKFPGLQGPDRYLFLPWFVLSVLVALGLQRTLVGALGRRFVVVFVVGGLVSATAFNAHQHARARAVEAQEFEVQGRYLWEADHRQVYLPSTLLAGTYWYSTGLCSLRPAERGACPRALLQGIDEPVQDVEVLMFRAGKMTRLPAEQLRQALSVDTVAALQAHVELRDGVVQWSFGPESAGRYFIASPQLGRYPIARQGTMRTAQRQLGFRLLYEEPGGAVRASPWLEVADGAPLRWQRPGE